MISHLYIALVALFALTVLALVRSPAVTQHNIDNHGYIDNSNHGYIDNKKAELQVRLPGGRPSTSGWTGRPLRVP